MPLGQLLEVANKGVLFSSISAKDRTTTLQDGGPSLLLSNSQINLRSSTLDSARKAVHALVVKAAQRSLVDGAIADLLQEWMNASKITKTASDIPATDRPPGFLHPLEISSPDMPPGFGVVSGLWLPRFSICTKYFVKIWTVSLFVRLVLSFDVFDFICRVLVEDRQYLLDILYRKSLLYMGVSATSFNLRTVITLPSIGVFPQLPTMRILLNLNQFR